MAKKRKKKRRKSPAGLRKLKSRIRKAISSRPAKSRKTAGQRSRANARASQSTKRAQRSAPKKENSRDKKQTKPKLDIGKNRLVFPKKGDDGITRYLPKESEVSKNELKKGLFIKDDPNNGPKEIANGLKAKFDIGKGRYVFPVKGADNKIQYLPKEEDAHGLEKGKGLFVKDEDAAKLEPQAEARFKRLKKSSISKPPPKDKDDQGRRNLATRPIPKAKDDTPLWHSKELPLPEAEKQKDLLKNLKPKYDIGKGRMIYPTELANGKIGYLPLKEDANQLEVKKGVFASIVPEGDLQKFLSDQVEKKEFEVKDGKIQAISEIDLSDAIKKAPKFLLREQRAVAESLPLQQKWV